MKKVLIGMTAIALAVATVPMFAAYEAHVINVTAHIENALDVSTYDIAFGTVFPQEYVEKAFNIALSESFMGAGRVDDVEYKIVQKLKPCPVHKVSCGPACEALAPDDPSCVPDTIDATPHYPTGWHYLSLCPFLSKTNTETDGTVSQNDTSHPSYYIDAAPAGPSANDSCQTVTTQATGRLSKNDQDIADGWIVDLKVPPVAGYVGQDWPTGCPTVSDNDKSYGCDLWIEVTGISASGVDPLELACTQSGGTVSTGQCCLASGDFPEMCATGACGCGPGNTHEVKTCNCGPGACWDSSTGSCVGLDV